MDIVDDLRDLNSMHTPNEVSGIAAKAADEIERLREENEKLMNGSRIVAEKISWQAFQKSVVEIERLREALNLIRVAIENYGLGGKSEGFALGYVDEVARVALQQKDSE